VKLVYSRQAIADLESIAAYYTTNASPAVADAIKRRLKDVIDRICQSPEAAPRVAQRSGVRVAAVIRYPFRIFYRLRGDTVDILHIRHTSRRPFVSRTTRPG
jgi:plasmid stabilization system protein ParE